MYENAKYHKDHTGVILNIGVEINSILSFVPLDPGNTDYVNIMRLVKAGKLVIAPAE